MRQVKARGPQSKGTREGPARHGPPKEGASLLEILIVVSLLGVIGGAIGTTLLRQQQFFRGTAELLSAREGVRDAAEILSSDIMGTSVRGDTLRLMADSAIELFVNIGSSVACDIQSGRAITLPPESGAAGNTLTALLVEPDTGDLALIHRDSADASGSEWERHRIAAISGKLAPLSCMSAFTGALPIEGGLPAGGFVLSLETSASAHVTRGAPIRFVRRVRYSLYRATDRRWYLGYRRCNAIGPSVCGAVQPVSGPFRPYTSDSATSGLFFRYLDSAGRSLGPGDSPLALARVDIVARAGPTGQFPPGGPVRASGDSMRASIAPRNREP